MAMRRNRNALRVAEPCLRLMVVLQSNRQAVPNAYDSYQRIGVSFFSS
jgi:hypothetical protein